MSSDLTITDAKPVPVSGALPLQHQPPLELDQGPLPDPGHKGPHEMAIKRPRRHAQKTGCALYLYLRHGVGMEQRVDRKHPNLNEKTLKAA